MEIKITSIGNLPPGKMLGIDSNGKNILVANVNGKYYAIGNDCTHLHCKLSLGRLDEEEVHCPCHDSTFDLKTGRALTGPAKNPEPVFITRVDGDQILVIIND